MSKAITGGAGTGDRPVTDLTDEEFDLSAQVEVADVFDGFSDDDGDNVGPTEHEAMRTVLLMLDDEQLPTFDFTKVNTVPSPLRSDSTARPTRTSSIGDKTLVKLSSPECHYCCTVS